MKIKQFFIDNKLIIKKVLNFFLIILFFLVYTYTIFACGYNSKLIPEESNKKELVNRKEANNFNHDINFRVSSSLSDSDSLVDFYFYGHEGNLGLNFYSDVFLTDNGILLNYEYKVYFSNGAIYYPSSSVNLLLSYDDIGYDISSLFNDSTISLNIYVSSYTLPYFLEGSEAQDWQFGLEFEIYLSYESEIYFYIEPLITLNIRNLILDDIWFDSYDAWISFFTSLSIDDDTETLKEGVIYSGTNPYYFYYNTYNEAFNVGFEEGQPKNIFYYDIEYDSPYLLVFDDISYIRPDDYDENLLFKNNYLDLQYLRSLYNNQYSKFRIIFTDSIYSLKDLYLSLDNSSLNDYNILVNGKAYSINSSGTLNIPSSELLQVMEFDSSLLDSTRLINASPDYANGFNNGFENGYSNGYSEGERDQEDYFEEFIIPAVKIEYEEIGFDKGYNEGKNVALNTGSGVALFDAFTLIGKGFEAWNPILNIQVLPGLTLGVFIAIPIVIAVVIVVIKLLQR